ncbi:hypothetical protein SEA_MOLEFICENT_46 [Microbacterium phage Moleficent]|uniref:Uncharacterized protein n=2 Tax=Akonivirus TaxID=2842540 RepID=A0A5J6T3I6_9CAUD|nr:hypothetical protein SEA_PHRIEDRICE_47 [Microbacterium phage PhriedRice]UXE04135.1 hypothetical protein Fullmetal_46 [Microbacterium phage Fullmetal]WNM74550.1 hypothetical protein SEA_MOLEFICENT_46 [Microbacterium phage Moleficent]
MATQEVAITDKTQGVQHVHIISISEGAVTFIGSIITPLSIGAASAADLNNVFGRTQEMTAAEAAAGTVTEVRTVSPKVLHDEIARQIAALA